MRRLLLAVLPALLAFALAACGGDAEEEQKAKGQGGETTTEGTPVPPPGGETAAPPPADSAEEEKVRAAVREYLQGLAGQNAPQVCDALTGEAQRRLGRDLNVDPGQCEDVAREAAKFATGQAGEALRNADALDVKIEDDRATVTVSVAGTVVPLELTRVDDEWRVSDPNEEELREALP